MIAQRARVADVWAWLGDVSDPEIPVVSVVELGIVRDVAWGSNVSGDAALKITLTPTYSGCPATRVIERDISNALRARGIERIELHVRLAPAWTTEWISEAGREKLRAYGISPPARGGSAGVLDIANFVEPAVTCPRCTATNVELTSRFGSTPCKSLYRCHACREPFDYFKCH